MLGVELGDGADDGDVGVGVELALCVPQTEVGVEDAATLAFEFAPKGFEGTTGSVGMARCPACHGVHLTFPVLTLELGLLFDFKILFGR